MIKLKGSVTTVEEMDVEISPKELSAQTQKNFTVFEIVQMAYLKWLGSKGLDSDIKLCYTASMGYYFKKYEDRGSHYSGYYEARGAYEEGDEIIYNQFQELMAILK
ncbi:hypothetical protein EBOKLHFM_00218 [Klebsiella phage KP13-26]|nr:hypothetical protein EBOKLHFM_00218 [Klebsiella phage KP13-26]